MYIYYIHIGLVSLYLHLFIHIYHSCISTAILPKTLLTRLLFFVRYKILVERRQTGVGVIECENNLMEWWFTLQRIMYMNGVLYPECRLSLVKSPPWSKVHAQLPFSQLSEV